MLGYSRGSINVYGMAPLSTSGTSGAADPGGVVKRPAAQQVRLPEVHVYISFIKALRRLSGKAFISWRTHLALRALLPFVLIRILRQQPLPVWAGLHHM